MQRKKSHTHARILFYFIIIFSRMEDKDGETSIIDQDLKVLDEMTDQLVCQVRSSEGEDRTFLMSLTDSFVSVTMSALETRQILKENIKGLFGLMFLLCLCVCFIYMRFVCGVYVLLNYCVSFNFRGWSLIVLCFVFIIIVPLCFVFHIRCVFHLILGV